MTNTCAVCGEARASELGFLGSKLVCKACALLAVGDAERAGSNPVGPALGGSPREHRRLSPPRVEGALRYAVDHLLIEPHRVALLLDVLARATAPREEDGVGALEPSRIMLARAVCFVCFEPDAGVASTRAGPLCRNCATLLRRFAESTLAETCSIQRYRDATLDGALRVIASALPSIRIDAERRAEISASLLAGRDLEAARRWIGALAACSSSGPSLELAVAVRELLASPALGASHAEG